MQGARDTQGSQNEAGCRRRQLQHKGFLLAAISLLSRTHIASWQHNTRPCNLQLWPECCSDAPSPEGAVACSGHSTESQAACHRPQTPSTL